jgi:hypothetical protein
VPVRPGPAPSTSSIVNYSVKYFSVSVNSSRTREHASTAQPNRAAGPCALLDENINESLQRLISDMVSIR